MKVTTSRALIGTGFLCFLLASSPVHAIELLTNGGFETGNFTGWTIADQAGGNGLFEVTSSTIPSSGVYPTVGPAAGSFYAVSTQGGPGTHAISQSFTVPSPASSVILSYKMFVQTEAAVAVNPGGLNYSVTPNQHARVDILTAASGAFDTGATVLANYYLGIDGLDPRPYTSYSFNITPFVGGGGTFKVRFAEVDNQGFFNQGVDQVSINFTPVPEPASIGLALMVAGSLLGVRRRVA